MTPKQTFQNAWLSSPMTTTLERFGETSKHPDLRCDVFKFTIELRIPNEKKRDWVKRVERIAKFTRLGYRVFIVDPLKPERFPTLYDSITRWKTNFWAGEIQNRVHRDWKKKQFN